MARPKKVASILVRRQKNMDQQEAEHLDDQGTAPFGWEPQAHLEGPAAEQNFKLQVETWRTSPHHEHEGEYRCVHYNRMHSAATADEKHTRSCELERLFCE